MSETYWDDRVCKGYWKSEHDESLEIIKKEPYRAFPKEIWHMLTSLYPNNSDFENKKILVPSSGDNICSFGFCLLSADVTSTDKSKCMINNAKNIASKNKIKIDLQERDSITLCNLQERDSITPCNLPDNEYDLIFTSCGVHHCINDIERMYESFYRVLKPTGRYIFFEGHNYAKRYGTNLGVNKEKRNLILCNDYRPTDYTGNKKIKAENGIQWKNEDYLDMLIKVGFFITDVREVRKHKDDIPIYGYNRRSIAKRAENGFSEYNWVTNPRHALPSWIGISASKNKILHE